MDIQATLLDSTPGWQAQLRDVISSADELLAALGLSREDVLYSAAADRDFALKVPRAFVRRMRRGDPRDPLLLQVLADQRELSPAAGFSRDPVGETGTANPRPGIIHKYHGRVLLVVAGGCAVNCRYCFRRHFPYAENNNSRQQWRDALDYVLARPEITEVILSGGDPLIAGDRQIQELVGQIAAIPQVRRLRIHTRLPVVIPDRVTSTLLEAVTHPALKTVLVLHSNHAREIDESVAAAVAAARQFDIEVLNQAVMLGGINDSASALVDLSEALFAAGILPYYLHLLDPVEGAAHFDIPESRARELMLELRSRLPGYMVPQLVREIAGADAKTGIAL